MIVHPRTYFKKTWVLENQSAISQKSTGSMVGDGRLELVFVKGNGYRAKFAQHEIYCGEGIYLGGHLDQNLELEVLPETSMTFVKLEPWTLGLLSGFDFRQMLNQTAPLAEINPGLYRKLANKGAHIQAQQIMPILLQEVEQNQIRHRDFGFIQYASQFLEDYFLDFKVAKKSLLAETRVSSRTLENKFGRLIGLTPQKFANTIRFRRISESIYYQQDQASLTTLAHQFGYYDQAHFIRTCQEILGIPPSLLSNESCFITDPGENFRYYTMP